MAAERPASTPTGWQAHKPATTVLSVVKELHFLLQLDFSGCSLTICAGGPAFLENSGIKKQQHKLNHCVLLLLKKSVLKITQQPLWEAWLLQATAANLNSSCVFQKTTRPANGNGLAILARCWAQGWQRFNSSGREREWGKPSRSRTRGEAKGDVPRGFRDCLQKAEAEKDTRVPCVPVLFVA